MPIHFSLGRKTITPGERQTQRKVYATAQNAGVCQTDELARKVIKRGCVGDRGTVVAVLSAVVDCLREELLEGRRVHVGDLGVFQCVINGTGADSVDDFSVSRNIQGLTVRWEPSEYFRNLHSQAKYVQVPRRSAQRQARRENNREIREILDESRRKRQGDE